MQTAIRITKSGEWTKEVKIHVYSQVLVQVCTVEMLASKQVLEVFCPNLFVLNVEKDFCRKWDPWLGTLVNILSHTSWSEMHLPMVSRWPVLKVSDFSVPLE